MKQGCLGRFVGTTPLSGDYFLLRLALDNVSDIAPGNSLEIDSFTYGVMRCHWRNNEVELLARGAPPPWKPGDQWPWRSNTHTFKLPPSASRCLLVGEKLGMAQALFLAERLKQSNQTDVTVLLGFGARIAFRPAPSHMLISSLPSHVIATMPLLEEWGIANRIASTDDIPGCYEGRLPSLARHWLEQQEEMEKIEIFVSASQESSREITTLAGEQGLPCQTVIV